MDQYNEKWRSYGKIRGNPKFTENITRKETETWSIFWDTGLVHIVTDVKKSRRKTLEVDKDWVNILDIGYGKCVEVKWSAVNKRSWKVTSYQTRK